MVEMGLASLCQLEHRGAKGADPATGDGAGLLVQVPDRFLRSRLGIELPEPGAYATGIAFLPSGAGEADDACARFDELAAEEGLSVLAWRTVPVEAGLPGSAARAVMPAFRQVVVAGPAGESGLALDRRAYLARNRAEHENPRPLLRFSVFPDARVQGDVDGAPAREVLPRPVRPALRVGHGPGPRPLLDQHLPQLAIGPPLPLCRPQWGVQHGPGQPQLDADPGGHAGQRPLPRGPVPGLPHSHARRQRLDELRRGAGAAPPERPVIAPRRADDGARGVGKQGRPVGVAPCVLPVPRLLDGALGRPRGHRLH